MPSPELDRLVEIRKLVREPQARAEHEGLVASAAERLIDARNDGGGGDEGAARRRL
jgi:hypothetical protein